MNHDPEAEANIDRCRFAYHAMNLCEKYGVRYTVRKDLLAYCDFPVRNVDTRKVVRPCPTKSA